MTIHASVRALRPAAVNLGEAVRGATSRRGLLRLVSLLGLPGAPRKTLNAASEYSVWQVAERGTLRVLLAELRCDVTPAVTADVARRMRDLDPIRPLLAMIAGPQYCSLTFACFTPDGELRHLVLDPRAPLGSELDVLNAMVSPPGEPGVALALRYAAALDSAAVGARFFAEVRAQRAAIADAWTGLPTSERADREQLALLLLCRLMFLYFLQRQGHLAGDEAYLIRNVRGWQREGSGDTTFFRAFLVPLFFGALNTRPERRDPAAVALGALPYLNGGLFERHAIERRHPSLDLPDRCTIAIFEHLLERFRFTATDAAYSDSAGTRGIQIDPEMLGRIFEGLMSADRRGDTGTFYTPPAMVDRLVTATLAEYIAQRAAVPIELARRAIAGETGGLTYAQQKAMSPVLREVRVLDPACGSGAFLLGALARLSAARVVLGESSMAVRRDIVGTALHGVDLLDDAALLCSLRLWLALADTSAAPLPLPNLDRRIRQGDALLDPLEVLTARIGSDVDARALRAGPVRSALRALAPLAERYIDAEPDERLSLRLELGRAETQLGAAWLSALDRRLHEALRDAHARGAARDLWDAETAGAHAALRELPRLERRREELALLQRQLEDGDALPFFSFRVHFADTPSFNIILSNPPWIRSHKWPAAMGAAVRERYSVCRNGGWPAAAQYSGSHSSGQVDLSMLFLERCITLLASGGVLGMLLPAKTLRSLYAGGGRALLARETGVVQIDDYSLDQKAIFRADAFTCSIVARRRSAGEAPGSVHVRMIRRNVEPLEFDLAREDLPLMPGDEFAPWLIAPPDVVAVFRRMQAVGVSLARADGLRVRRGVATGANDVLVVREFSHKLGGLSHIRAEGYFRARKLSRSTAESRRYVAYVETSALRPLIRGADVSGWKCEPSARVLLQPVNGGPPIALPRLNAYLRRHDQALRARSGLRADMGASLRIPESMLGHKVVWQDIAATLHAAVVPDAVKGDNGGLVPVLPLNTTYFVAVPDGETALLIAAYLNSMPLRTFARAAAERAKDARFRFFAWTVGMLPLPASWRCDGAIELRELARTGTAAGGLTPVQQCRLDALVAQSFGLNDAEFIALRGFDRWLAGVA